MTRPQTGAIRFGTLRIEYQLRRSDRKRTINIAVDPSAGVLVTAPRAMDAEHVHRIVSRKALWIVKQLRSLREIDRNVNPREFVSGESFLYLGRNHRLKILLRAGADVSVRALRGRFEVVVDSQLSTPKRCEAIRSGLYRWYQNHAKERIAERVTLLAPRLGVMSPSILIRDQQKRWASCDRKGRIRFNWRIIMAPMSLVDYVVAHELSHLIHPDHSTVFWKLLRSVMPDYESRRERLRCEGPRFWF